MMIDGVIWKRQGKDDILFILKDNYLNAQLLDDDLDSPVMISQHNITIEMTNCCALMRGIEQRSFNVSKLDVTQKQELINNIKRRNITVDRNFYETHVTIHALPD